VGKKKKEEWISVPQKSVSPQMCFEYIIGTNILYDLVVWKFFVLFSVFLDSQLLSRYQRTSKKNKITISLLAINDII
jgi:hypothetical protein